MSDQNTQENESERIGRILREQKSMETDRSVFEQHWQEIAERILPRSAEFKGARQKGGKRTEKAIDATGALALQKFGAAIESVITPRTQKWHTLSNERFSDDEEVQRYFQEVRDILFRLRYAPWANFASQSHEHYISSGAFGTGCTFVDNVIGKGPRYCTYHLREIYFTENFQGMIDVVHRKYCMTARQAIQQFGEDNLPQQVRTTAKNDPSKQFNFLHRVEPNDKRDMSRQDKEGMPFRSVHICMEGSKIVQEGGYWSQPYAISRYYTAPGEVYGRSPAMVVLPDIKLLNEINRAIIEGAQMAVRPPMLLPEDGILQPFKMMPGALNFGGMNRDGKPLAVPLNTATDFSVAMTLAEQKRQTINDGFFITLFQILVDNPQMTATEAMLRAQEKGQLLAPTAGRIQAEFLGTLILREIDIAYQNGLLPEPPEQLKEIGGEYDIEYTSPLVRLQMSEEASGIMNVINAAGTIGQFDQNIARTLNGDAALRFIAKASGAPLQVVKTEDEMAAQDAADQQQLQLQQLLAAAPVAATAAKDFAQANQIAQTPAPSPALQG